MKEELSYYCSIIFAAQIVIFNSFGSVTTRQITPIDYQNLREKYYDFLTGGSEYSTTNPAIIPKLNAMNSLAQSLWNNMDKSKGRTYLWSDVQKGGDPIYILTTYERLRDMALTLKTRGTTLYGNKILQSDLISALDWIYINWHNPNKPEVGNWYVWQIGAPLSLSDITILLYNDLTLAQKTNYMNTIKSKIKTTFRDKLGANRAWEAQIYMLYGAITEVDSQIIYARDGLDVLFDYARFNPETETYQDGFYYDGSYIGHGSYAYSGGYGIAYYYTVLDLIYLLKGSPWEVTNVNQNNMIHLAFNAYQPLVYNGAMFDMVRGRDISRYIETGHNAGGWVISTFLIVADISNSTDALRLKRQIKEWIQRDPVYYTDYYTSVFSLVKALAIVNDANITPCGDQQIYKQYPTMHKAVIHRPGYALGLSMFGRNVKNYESINSENLKGWHQSDGMMLLYTKNETDPFGGNFWATVNSYRLPGTTVQKNSKVDDTYNNDRWAGGVTDGTYGVSGMYLSPKTLTLVAKKSWFMFDDEIVALGSNICSTGDSIVETIIENRKLNITGNNAFSMNGTAESTAFGWAANMSGVTWMHLTGNAAGSDIGYFFPTAASIKGVREARADTWYNINHLIYKSETTIPDNYLTLWFDHGTNPSNGSYAYVILPNKTSEQTLAYRNNPDVTVIKNDGNIHAVKESGLNMIGVNFWTDTIQSLNVGSNSHWLTSNRKTSVLTHEYQSKKSRYFEVAVSDPIRYNKETIDLEFNFPVVSTVSSDTAVTIIQLRPKLKISVNVNGAEGKSFKMKFLLY